jgi:hypothetical protein
MLCAAKAKRGAAINELVKTFWAILPLKKKAVWCSEEY